MSLLKNKYLITANISWLVIYLFGRVIPTFSRVVYWNAFLALIAINLAIFLTSGLKISRWLKGILFTLWLLFQPNAFYMATDAIHMSDFTTIYQYPRDLRHFLNISRFTLLFLGISFGIWCGIVGIRLVVARYFNRTWQMRWLFYFSISVLTSIAVYIGRYGRLNSWNVITHPALSLQKILALPWITVAMFTLFFTFLQLAIIAVIEYCHE
ncbi:MAG: DUF1361 domain-containing protein [Streptococcaceae bacterium]|jgi:uncharacterized membrane protein|nr:DUF1361 domain-containing protein [Streptococcaceae bacterium]